MVPGGDRAVSPVLRAAVKLAPALLGVVVVVLAAWALFVACRRWRGRSAEEEDKGRETPEDGRGEVQKRREMTPLLGANQELGRSAEPGDKRRRSAEVRSRNRPPEEDLSSAEDRGAKRGEDLTADGGQTGDRPGRVSDDRREEGRGPADGGHYGEPGAEGSASERKRVPESADAAGSTRSLEETGADAPVPEGHREQGDAPHTHLNGPAGARNEGRGASRRERGHGDVPRATELSEGRQEVAADKRVVAVPPMPQVADVHFRVHYVTASPWQQLAVTGSVPELGGWNGFVTLDAAAAGFWSRSVALPADSHVEWKFVLVENGKIQRWEECENRRLDTVGGTDLHLHRWWGFQ
ncbi:starch-binding domain-containing protein 1-like [Scleropages formosus]|uniref:CBM20 domain-containing protein n=1 Tax=Scleropages formosus TaxID=113540 RepID=A0A8D0CLK4_SCLFO|nr:starch-binding domain-containing protein 1 [Scleropages formosus]